MDHNKRNVFLANLRVNQSDLKSDSSQSSILEELGLLNLPNFINAQISKDGKYIEFKIVENKCSWDEFDDYEDEHTICKNHHLVFRIPLSEKDLSYLHEIGLSDYIYDRYSRYESNYIYNILDYSQKEAEFLQQRFPSLVFRIKIREKSLPSYERKMDQRISEDKPLDINDIVAERIIIYEYQGICNEDFLSSVCYEVAEALDEFRQTNTSFRIKTHGLSDSTARSKRPYLSKDYFEKPKDNGYKSLHISLEDVANPDCSFETQVRTQKMEKDSKLNSEQSHKKYKPRLFDNKSVLRIPTYHEIDNFNGDLNFKSPIPTEKTFFHYYQKLQSHYRYELGVLEEYIDFENLSEKAKHIHAQIPKHVEEKETEPMH